jgi:hypothetical protein
VPVSLDIPSRCPYNRITYRTFVLFSHGTVRNITIGSGASGATMRGAGAGQRRGQAS